MRIAAFDIGSNSVRCTVVEVPVGGPRVTIDDEKEYTRLGRGLAQSGRLDSEAMDATVAALRRMLHIARGFGVTHVRAVATEAVRVAGNGVEFIARLRDELELEVEVISPAEEGRLAFLSAAESVGLEGRCAVVDMGGGSVEIVRATDEQIESIVSLPLGAVVLSERYHRQDPIPKRDLKRMRKHVRRTLSEALGDAPDPVVQLVGSGGTATALAALVGAVHAPGLTSMHRYEVRRAELAHLVASLERSTAAERASMKGMPPNRVDIILAGAVAYDEVMRALQANELVVNARGMREGVVIDTVERIRGRAESQGRMHAVREFARRCRADAAHAEQVLAFSLALFDELSETLGLDESARPLLEAAALLHDVGYHIAYERHHKHSHHLISYAELPGFSGHDLRVIAAIARYHRGALPKPGHEAMQGLGPEDRRRVEALAALLRVADGLDRTRSQRIEALDVTVDDARIVIRIDGQGPLDVEVYGAQRKTDLLERASGRRVDVGVVA